MARSSITEDYYMVLEVAQTATPELIVKSYKRLALKLHPDRNAKQDATEAFQLLQRAYETLSDESERRAYDLIYSSINRSASTTKAYTSRPPPTTDPGADALSEATQLAALTKSKEERAARWRTKKTVFDSSISELQRGVQTIQQEIKNLDSILVAEAAAEAQKNSWTTWLLSPIYKKPEESEEEKARKDREKQERRIEKDMKERRLQLKKADLQQEEMKCRKAKEEVDAAIACDDQKIGAIHIRKWTREERLRREKERERQEKEKAEKERLAKIWKQQQEQRVKQEREAAEVRRKQQAEILAAQQKRQEEENRRWQKIIEEQARQDRERAAQYQRTARFDYDEPWTASCDHGEWWSKVQGRTACPECSDVWTYLLKCPGCEKKACPKCQAVIRPRLPRGAARLNRNTAPRLRTPSPDYTYTGYWD